MLVGSPHDKDDRLLDRGGGASRFNRYVDPTCSSAMSARLGTRCHLLRNMRDAPELKYTTMTGIARIECFVAENGDIFGTKVLCAFCAMRRDRAKSLNPRRVQQQLQQQQQLKGRIIAWEIRLVDAHVIQLLQ